tara:strand:+ start:1828 stop:2217 length:390 start_codon:yes stop_codon:yes gene_type:complete
MIKGTGADVLEKQRIERLFYSYGKKFVRRILTDKEIKELDKKNNDIKKISYLSNNFACKEAFSKALGLGFSEGITYKDLEILRDKKGAPKINLSERANNKAQNLGFSKFFVSVSDTQKLTFAIVVGEGK